MDILLNSCPAEIFFDLTVRGFFIPMGVVIGESNPNTIIFLRGKNRKPYRVERFNLLEYPSKVALFDAVVVADSRSPEACKLMLDMLAKSLKKEEEVWV